MWGKIYAERKRQVLDNVALDDGSENLVLLTNVMFQNLYGTKTVKELVVIRTEVNTLRMSERITNEVSMWVEYSYVSKNW